jgi:nitronate monooxygenase
MERLPKIIQGGMGAGVSSWRLARAVSSLGQLGVVSGVALDVLLARRLQSGDKDGSVRGALESFPIRETAERIYEKYFVRGGKPETELFKPTPIHSVRENKSLAELCMVGNFVEVFLARQGHDNPVGINYLEKIQLPHLPSIYGAMLAGVACVIVGAGIAIRIPGVLDHFANHQKASYEIQVAGTQSDESTEVFFDPATYVEGIGPLERPAFLSIVSSNVVASTMVKRSNGRVDGFIVERFDAGGHNAPPRGRLQLDELGQPLYGEKDTVNLEKLREMGLPFWLAGGQARPERLEAAIALGASGIQVGTAFALCEESGIREDFRTALLEAAKEGRVDVFTDPLASPTGFPFKVARLEDSLSEAAVYEARERVCDLGFLRQAYKTPANTIGYRCPAEPVDVYVSKGGDPADTVGRKCLCNALVANVGFPQVRHGVVELPLITAGDDLKDIARFLAPGATSYSARDVVEALLGHTTVT